MNVRVQLYAVLPPILGEKEVRRSGWTSWRKHSFPCWE